MFLLIDTDIFPPEIIQFVRITAIIGFIATATLLINLNFLVFSKVFKERARKYWWLFLTIMIAPILVIIYIFTLLFGKF